MRAAATAAYSPLSDSVRPGCSSVLTRPEVAICLLSEVAFEHDEELRVHLPILLHVATLNAGVEKMLPCHIPLLLPSELVSGDENSYGFDVAFLPRDCR